LRDLDSAGRRGFHVHPTCKALFQPINIHLGERNSNPAVKLQENYPASSTCMSMEAEVIDLIFFGKAPRLKGGVLMILGKSTWFTRALD